MTHLFKGNLNQNSVNFDDFPLRTIYFIVLAPDFNRCSKAFFNSYLEDRVNCTLPGVYPIKLKQTRKPSINSKLSNLFKSLNVFLNKG